MEQVFEPYNECGWAVECAGFLFVGVEPNWGMDVGLCFFYRVALRSCTLIEFYTAITYGRGSKDFSRFETACYVCHVKRRYSETIENTFILKQFWSSRSPSSLML
jgi:hypothetical protein